VGEIKGVASKNSPATCPEDDATLKAYETRVAEVYRQAGFEPKFIESNTLIADKGAIHCVTMQVGLSLFGEGTN
jgi:hypothetical protein